MIAGPALVEWAAATWPRKSSATRASTPPTARSTTRSTPRTRRSRGRGASSRTCRPTSTSCRRVRTPNDDPSRRDEFLLDRAARSAQDLQDARGSSSGRRSRLVLRDRLRLGPLDHHRPRAPRRLAGRGVRRGRQHLRRRLDRGRLPQADALHRPGLDLPPAAAAPRGLPRLPDRQAGGAGVHHPLRLADAGRARPGAGAVRLRRAAQGVRRRRRRQSQAGRATCRFAWPSGDWGSLPIEGGIEVAYKAELAEAADYAAHLETIKHGSTGCARRSARPSTSRSKRSSTRATRGRCCAGGCGSRANNCGRERFRSAIDHDAASNTDRAVASPASRMQPTPIRPPTACTATR